MGRFSYDLLQEPWINAVNQKGSVIQLGLFDILDRAHTLRGLDEQNPLIEAAIMRILLALTHRIVQGPATPKEWRVMYAKGRFESSEVEGYFTRWEERFDLFDRKYPFLQTPEVCNLDKDGNETFLGVQLLALAVAKGSMKTLFDHHLDEQDFFYCPHEAVRHLLAVQNFGLAGLNKKSAKPFGYQESYNQANLVGGIFCTLQGSSLFETLSLNTLIYRGDAPVPRTENQGEDAPVWEWEESTPVVGPNTPRGYLHYLTSRCRHVLLIPEMDNKRLVVRWMHFAQGEFFPEISEPFFPQRKNKDKKILPVRPWPGRLLWRDSLALFGFSEKEDLRPTPMRQIGRLGGRAQIPFASRYRCCAYSLAYDQADPLAWRKEFLSVPLKLLESQEAVALLQLAVERGEEAGSMLYNAVARYLYECLPQGAKRSKEKVYQTQALDNFWLSLEAPFQAFLLALEEPGNGDQALQEWGMALKRTALESFEQCVWQRYADRAKTYQAWVRARESLTYNIAKFISKGVI